ncbi:MAG: hypothetical protein ACP5QO_12370 [Clostridia bacterium]
MGDPRFGRLALQIQVGDAAGGLAFYSRLFGRGPDLASRVADGRL